MEINITYWLKRMILLVLILVQVGSVYGVVEVEAKTEIEGLEVGYGYDKVKAWGVLKNTKHATKVDFLEFVTNLQKRGFKFEEVGSDVRLISGTEGVELGKITDNGLDLEDFGYISKDLAASNVEKLPANFKVFDNGNDLTGKLEVVTDAFGNTKFRWSHASSKPDWLKVIEEGNKFNANRKAAYPYNEIYLEKPGGGYVRLDAYDHILNEIISRKFTQFSEIAESTAIKYIDELAKKYPPNTKIASVDSNTKLPLAGQTNNFGILDHGNTIQGTMILEIPVQIKTVPQNILDHAFNNNIKIRDINGKPYN